MGENGGRTRAVKNGDRRMFFFAIVNPCRSSFLGERENETTKK
jgi:hypothetical protein